MRRYVFFHNFGEVFVVRAKNKAAAINKFPEKVAGKFGFSNPYNRADVLRDVGWGFLTIQRVTEVK